MLKIAEGLILSVVILCLFTSTVYAQVINEFVGNSAPEWVEIYNASDSADYLKDYWIDDDTDFANDSGSSSKKQLTSLNITNINYPYFELSSMFNNTNGDYVVLFDSQGNKIDEYHYQIDLVSDLAIGRYPDASGSFFVLSSSTKGAPNSQSAPTATPTSTPIPTPLSTPTLTPTPTPMATKTPTPTIKATVRPTPTPTPSPQVLSDSTASSSVLKSESPIPVNKTKSNFNALPFVLIGSGFIFLGAATFPFLKSKIKGYNDIDAKNP